MQDGIVIGQQVFVPHVKEQYVLFANLYKHDEYIKMAKSNLAERERKRLHDCFKYSLTDNSYESKPLL